MKPNFNYQQIAAKKVLENAICGRYKVSVLAGTPGCGKTTISQMVLNSYFAKFPGTKALVLTEGQNTLKNQYISELENAHIKINFSYGDFASKAQVRIGLPQSIGQISSDSIDLLVIDEAQNFYFAEMVQEIIKKFNPKHILLMTGSPTKFNMHNKKNLSQYGIHYISAELLQKQGVFSAVNMDVVRVADKKDAEITTTRALNFATAKGDDLSKIMVACPSIKYAIVVSSVLTRFGYQTALSTSKNDQDDQEIARFRAGEANALIVVGKGILGFNDSNITALFDFKSSDNLDSAYQLFARVLRKHTKSVVKSYYRIADKDFNKQVLTLHKMLGLMKTEIFTGFTGKNLTLEIAGV